MIFQLLSRIDNMSHGCLYIDIKHRQKSLLEMSKQQRLSTQQQLMIFTLQFSAVSCSHDTTVTTELTSSEATDDVAPTAFDVTVRGSIWDSASIATRVEVVMFSSGNDVWHDVTLWEKNQREEFLWRRRLRLVATRCNGTS